MKPRSFDEMSRLEQLAYIDGLLKGADIVANYWNTNLSHREQATRSSCALMALANSLINKLSKE